MSSPRPVEDIYGLLNRLIAGWESEVVEFKHAANGYDANKIGEYFSALANEANLRGLGHAWLVFGVDDKSRRVVGSNYRLNLQDSNSIKMQITQSTQPNVTFQDIHEIAHPRGRVVIFAIPAAPQGFPIAWKGHFYGRSGGSLSPLGLDKLDRIRNQPGLHEWAAQEVPEATLDDLDETAVDKAKQVFVQKHNMRIRQEDVSRWSVENFLNRIKLMKNGKITRAALLLLGKSEASTMLHPNPAELTWKLHGEYVYEHFSIPFLLSTTELYEKIRNSQLRIYLNNELLPNIVYKYDEKIVLEALHNCIAHQDYSKYGRIVVTEKKDKLIIESQGGFYDGTPELYISGEKTPNLYRNSFLVHAMVELGMIDKMGYGIHQMHKLQASRYLPMPDYDISSEDSVKMTIYGGVMDQEYTNLLVRRTDIPLEQICALDRVQKGLPISDGMLKQLRKDKLVEGRKPNLYVSAKVASAAQQEVDYMHTRALDDDYYKKLITDFITEFGAITKSQAVSLLDGKLSDALDDRQKLLKVSYLLIKLKRSGVIVNLGSRKRPSWQFPDKDNPSGDPSTKK